MAQARKRLIPDGSSGYFHCINRCVRRTMLCGLDSHSGKSFEHRRGWIEQRLRQIAEYFAVSIYAYAVMSNHLHVVLQLDHAAGTSWTDEEVARRWCRLCPILDIDGPNLEAIRIQQIAADPGRVAKYRERLSNISWFMRCLVEPIARRANIEDECKGRFWEGRFKSHVLTDERSLLAAMAYVDLNPIRANMTNKLSQSHHTAVRQRILAVKLDKSMSASPLKPVLGIDQSGLRLNVREYLELVDHTGRRLRNRDKTHVPKRVRPALSVLGADVNKWYRRVSAFKESRIRIMGTCEAILQIAHAVGQQWLCGIGLARQLA